MTPLFAGRLRLLPADADYLAERLRVLASPVRLEMLNLLHAHPEGMTGVAVQLLLSSSLTQPTVSYHLATLAGIGLVTARRSKPVRPENRVGRFVIYTLNRDGVTALVDLIRPDGAW